MVSRVWEMLERSRNTLRDAAMRQREEGSTTKQLLQRSRATVSHIIGPPPSSEPNPQDVLAGVCSSIALRDLNLVDALLEKLDQMEADEDDPDSLARLYELDHLAARLRRNGENLRVLAGRDAGGSHLETLSVVDVVRAGISSIEQYGRVDLATVSALGIVGFAADDVSRLLAELLDNATAHSPPNSPVTVSAQLTERGSMMVRVEDSGIGLPTERLSTLNERLASAPVLDRQAVRHMGLAVIRRLSSRHGIRVWLARRAPHGTIASVLLPAELIHETPASTPAVARSWQATGREDQPAPNEQPRMKTGTYRGENRTSENRTGPPAPRPGESESDSGARLDGDSQQPATTVNGLPRRRAQSLKESAVVWPPQRVDPDNENAIEANGPEESGTGSGQGHQRLLADLDAFAKGEQEAKSVPESETDTAQGSAQ